MRVNFGLCCINTILREHDIFCSRTTIREGFTVSKAKDLALKNIADIEPILEWNAQNNIWCYRLSSDMFPHITDPETPPYTIEFAADALRKAGAAARKYSQRITMHPGQYNQLATPNPDTLAKTFQDLSVHADILDYMGVPPAEGIIIIHGGGTYGDKPAAIERWVKNFKALPAAVRRRLVIENDEKSYNVQDVLLISQKTGIPVVFDMFHHQCYMRLHPDHTQLSYEEAFRLAVETWVGRSTRPVMHISEQYYHSQVGTHSNYINGGLPEWLMRAVHNSKRVGWILDLEVEAKMKEQAILRLRKIINKRNPEFVKYLYSVNVEK